MRPWDTQEDQNLILSDTNIYLVRYMSFPVMNKLIWIPSLSSAPSMCFQMCPRCIFASTECDSWVRSEVLLVIILLNRQFLSFEHSSWSLVCVHAADLTRR